MKKQCELQCQDILLCKERYHTTAQFILIEIYINMWQVYFYFQKHSFLVVEFSPNSLGLSVHLNI
jgi:hypothetical protein